ncbi:MAG: hypothetical protein CMB37_06075 [Euryarchaeota archaeon]|nr:hypothetical protein [Euryarchaeota archaeon]
MVRKDSPKGVEISFRWPTFDPETVIPSALPIGKKVFELGHNEMPCEISIGQESSFHISRKIIDLPESSSGLEKWSTLKDRIPRRINRERRGWFLTPSRMHRFSRRLIPYAVVGIITSLAIHAFEPGLVKSGIIEGSFAGSVRLGLLDYPVLLLIFLPVFFIPIVLRLFASVWDFQRTRIFRSDTPTPPSISLPEGRSSDLEVKATITFPEVREHWSSAKARVCAGILNPRRKMLLDALGRVEGQQNPPGISTPLSIRQYASSELGTGYGESTPLEGPDSERLFLSPLQIQQSGDSVELDLEGGIISLPMPESSWPGSEYHPIFACHWELQIMIKRDNLGPLLFVHPLIIQGSSDACIIDSIEIRSGRVEMADN